MPRPPPSGTWAHRQACALPTHMPKQEGKVGWPAWKRLRGMLCRGSLSPAAASSAAVLSRGACAQAAAETAGVSSCQLVRESHLVAVELGRGTFFLFMELIISYLRPNTKANSCDARRGAPLVQGSTGKLALWLGNASRSQCRRQQRKGASHARAETPAWRNKVCSICSLASNPVTFSLKLH